MTLLASIKHHLELGDPTVRSWFLVQPSWVPFVLSACYVFFVTRLGPFLMRDRKPIHPRKLMVSYNFSIVAVYTYVLIKMLYYALTTDCIKKICSPTTITEKREYYEICAALWIIYAIKYVEYADTVFYNLRKKFHLISPLHVIHHAALPIIIWFIMRTERTGFQVIPGVINGIVHIVMYSYYGLSAMGPEFQYLLWWKKYLTLLQMTQFVVILILQFVVAPAFGCKTTQQGIGVIAFFAALFLFMFYNFYTKTYKKPASGVQGKGKDVNLEHVQSRTKHRNGNSSSRKDN